MKETRRTIPIGQRRPEKGAARARAEELFERHARMVGALSLALLRDRAEAEDATQQVFLSAYRALLGGSQPREPAAWLATIARNECRARLRSRTHEPGMARDLESVPGGTDPAAEAFRRADLAALWAAVGELPGQQREALLLREFGGLSYEELAAALSVTMPAVESLLVRARRSLRARLAPVYGAVAGGSWIESIPRIFTSNAPAAATKAVAIGLGAAAVTGGAVLAPRLVDHVAASPHPLAAPAASPHSPPRTTSPSAPPTVFSLSTLPDGRGTAESSDARFATLSERSDGADHAGRSGGGDGSDPARVRERRLGPEAEQESTPARTAMPTTSTPSAAPVQAGDDGGAGDGTSSDQPSSASVGD